MNGKIPDAPPKPQMLSNPLTIASPMDLMSQAALTLHQDASSSRQMARERRQLAREDSLECHRRAADKLRDMADSALGSALLQGVASLGSAGLSLGASLQQIKTDSLQQSMKSAGADFYKDTVADSLFNKGVKELTQQSEALTRTSKNLTAGAQGLTALVRFDPFSVHHQFQAVEKKEIENQAMAAEDRAKEHGDMETEARRLENSSLKQMQQLFQARHQALMTAARG